MSSGDLIDMDNMEGEERDRERERNATQSALSGFSSLLVNAQKDAAGTEDRRSGANEVSTDSSDEECGIRQRDIPEFFNVQCLAKSPESPESSGPPGKNLRAVRISCELACNALRLKLSPLHTAAMAGNLRILKMLLNKGFYCPLRVQDELYVIASGFPDQNVGEEIFRMARASAAACSGDPTQVEFRPCLHHQKIK
jgi:hypothetical protein